MRDLAGVLPDIEIRFGEPMSAHTSLRVGGRVRAMIFPKTEAELSFVLRALRERGTDPLLFGAGTNLLVSGAELDIVTVKTAPGVGEICLSGGGGASVFASCGVPLARLAVFARERGLGGFEFAHGIPGSVGGAVCMNAGAYGSDIGSVVRSVTAIAPDGEISEFSRDECDFNYRHSAFSDNDYTVLSAIIDLFAENSDNIRRNMNEFAERRRAAQPLDLPSAGSAFKRPPLSGGVPVYAAALIERCGLKGFGIGGAAVSEKHAGFIVNRGGATFEDVIRVMERVKSEVFRQSGIELEPEIKIIGGDGKWMSL
ncbi:MAG: UDP-N-acetylmuramate dehydrogenase [Oscillospiraceae bacterium]|jgi:UDP-N-acetylmuramate dehydrogenase|nr:UDP-N-acetylmuramate dehydrogenase [Oscillospiraceae bacterium]